MDQNQTVPPATASNAANAQPVPQTPPARKKPNMIGIIILALLIGATIIIAAAYFLLPQKAQPSKQTNAIPSGGPIPSPMTPTPTPWDHIPLTTYTDQQYAYHFYYPQSWKLENDKANPEKFVLSYAGSVPGEIQGEFLSQNEFSKVATVTCKPTREQPCFTIDKTASSSAYVFPTVDSNSNQVTDATVYVTRLGGAGFVFKITKSNATSYDVLLSIINTLQFPSDKLSSPLKICPDSWSADKKTVKYHGITIPASDVDTTWIQNNCH